jgi:hypothetical protein
VLGEDGKLDTLLCPSFVYGFSLQRKIWCRFYIDCLEEISWKASPMNSLLLPDRQKSILTALVSSHAFPDEAREESELKGKGLVILLHGSPGSGKTLTAGMGHLYISQAFHTNTLQKPLLKLPRKVFFPSQWANSTLLGVFNSSICCVNSCD